ncbi:signal peptidase I [Candidatus Daviesbacteria bacterium]|nr:signal peptidase I [Candidatus Daviesbacteria bacterium]
MNFKKVLKIFRNISEVSFNVFVYLILPLAVLTLITFKTPVLAGFRSFVVLTGSMQPLIPTGSIVYSQKSPSYGKGDIVSFESGGVVITHRIIGVVKKEGGTFFKTKGDANNVSDTQLIPQNKVIGKIQFLFPYLGKLLFFLRTLPGFILMIVLPTIIFITLEILNIKKELEKQIEKKLKEKMSIV